VCVLFGGCLCLVGDVMCMLQGVCYRGCVFDMIGMWGLYACTGGTARQRLGTSSLGSWTISSTSLRNPFLAPINR
jgi:hypothetical protein